MFFAFLNSRLVFFSSSLAISSPCVTLFSTRRLSQTSHRAGMVCWWVYFPPFLLFFSSQRADPPPGGNPRSSISSANVAMLLAILPRGVPTTHVINHFISLFFSTPILLFTSQSPPIRFTLLGHHLAWHGIEASQDEREREPLEV